MGLFGLDADKIIDEKALVAALFEHLKAQPLVLTFDSHHEEDNGAVASALAGMTLTVELKG